jgi:hypothetical protein
MLKRPSFWELVNCPSSEVGSNPGPSSATIIRTLSGRRCCIMIWTVLPVALDRLVDYSANFNSDKRIALGTNNVWVADRVPLANPKCLLSRRCIQGSSFRVMRLGCFRYALAACLLRRSNCPLEADEPSWASFLFCVSDAVILYSAQKPKGVFIRVGQQVRKRTSGGPRRLVFLNDGKSNRAQNRPRVL